MVDYIHHHHFFLLPLLHFRSLEWEPSSCLSFHHTNFSRLLKSLNFPNYNGRGHLTLVLHVVKNGDEAPISLLG
jgi:hypothetical protein